MMVDNRVQTTLTGVEGRKAEPRDMQMAAEITKVLDRHYPNHAWAVHVDSEQGVVNIFNWAISFRYGYRLKLRDLNAPGKNQANLKPVIEAGGEILERAWMKRGAWEEGRYLVGGLDGVKKHKNIVGPDGEVVII